MQSPTGGRVTLRLDRDGASPPSIELRDAELDGQLDADGRSIIFQLRATALVTEPNIEVTVLSGGAAVSRMPENEAYRLRLDTTGKAPEYKMLFMEVGEIQVELDFVAAISEQQGNWQRVDFSVAALF